ncbi:hypothetical protein DPSP01_002899 [Paraphaeosphaeria sporulosa]
MSGIVPSSVFLSAIRIGFAVYHYMDTVQENLKKIDMNLRIELSHAGALTGQKVDLLPLWDAFLDNKFVEAEKHGKDWLTGRFERALKDITKTRKKYRALLTRMQKQEKGKLAE